MDRRRILVTGASGFIGSHVVDRLLSLGHEVLAPYRGASSQMPWRLVDHVGNSRFTALPGTDLRNLAALQIAVTLWKPDAVVHAAASGVQQQKQNDPVSVAQSNVCGTTALIEACSIAPLTQFVYIGTAYEYSPSDMPILENRRLHPPTFYGATKAAAWTIADYYRRAMGLPLITLRVFPCYGPREDTGKLIPFIIGNALKQRPLNLLTPQHLRDFLHVSDLCDAIVLALSGKLETGDIYNVASGQATSVLDIAKTIYRLVRTPLIMGATEEDQVPARDRVLGNPATLIGDIRKLQLCGWQPRVALDFGMEEVIEWYRQNWTAVEAHS